MAHYRIERTLPNGWRIRLDMVSWDGVFTTTPTALGEVVLTELGALKAEFDSLPYGLMNPMTLEFTIVWDMLPGALRTYLEQGYGSYGGMTRRNTWYLYTDRGTSGATWSLEFAGVEDNVEALELEALPNGMFGYSVELVDIVYFHLKTRTGTDFVGCSGTRSSRQRSLYQVYLIDANSERTQEHELYYVGLDGYMMSVRDLLDAFRNGGATFEAVSHSSISGSFDYSSALRDMMTHAVDFYSVQSTTSVPRQPSAAALGSDSIFILSEIRKGSDLIGGICSAADALGIGNPSTSLYDILRQFAEQSFVRVGYRFEASGSGPTTAIRAIFDVKLITQARDFAKTSGSSDQTLDLDSSLSYSSITVRGDNILKAEVRYETQSDKDATQIVKIQQGARASRSFNFEPILINMPVDIGDQNRDNYWPRFKAPIRQTNQLYYNTLGTSMLGAFIKVHEKTKVTWGSGATDSVTVDSDGMDTPVKAADFKNNTNTQTTYYLQINDAQVNSCISAGVTSGLISVFANEKNAILEAEYPLSANTKVMPDYICGRYTLTGAVTTTFTQLNWSRAIVLSIEVDLMSDTVKHKYMLVK